jgi:hypothetical protein
VLFIPSCPGYTGLTGALDRSDRCESLVVFASSELLNSCVYGSRCCWSVLGLFGVVLLGLCRVFLQCMLYFWGGFVVGPREVTEAFWNACCAGAVATGLIGSIHWSDR